MRRGFSVRRFVAGSLTVTLCVSFFAIATFSVTFADTPAEAERSKFSELLESRDSLRERLEQELRGRAEESLALYVADISPVPASATNEGNVSSEVFAFNADRLLKPASVLKVLTSLAALELLGPHYRFATRVFADSRERGAVTTLYVQGNGDPGLTVESAWAMARAIKRRGVQSVQSIVVDASLFEGERGPIGQRAYQTGSSALAFNYNAFSFEVCPGDPGGKASVVPDPFELKIPLVGSILTKKGGGSGFSVEQALPSAPPSGILSYRLKGAIGEREKCSTVYRSMPNPAMVFGATYAEMLRSIGVKVVQGAKEGSTPPKLDLLYSQDSAPLSQLLRDLNNFSNNFIAEQILFSLGQTELGTYSRARGLERMRAFLRSLGFSSSEFEIQDASGLSHANRVSARMIGAVLKRAAQNQEIAPEFESSLAVGERSGTLKKRPFDPRGVILRGKTGTLDGVSSLAGYVVGASGRKFAFVVFQNAASSTGRAHAFEDKIVSILSRS
jgi:D-alanyl-D-alanine carboxypeptidase/D-alanyl-D-alanine-endopeptidase (penicillin-binding protein 4)